MDAFTENILARARERQRLLREYGANNPLKETTNTSTSEPILSETKKVVDRKEVASDSNLSVKVTGPQKENVEGKVGRFHRQNSKTRVSSELPGSPMPVSKTLNIEREDFNLEIKLSSTENVRVQVEIEEDSGHSDAGSCCSESGLREASKNRLKRLGRLYAGGEEADISSPIHRTEAKFYQNDRDVEEERRDGCKSNRAVSKLAHLAESINQWEDDMSRPTRNANDKPTAQKTWKPQAPQPAQVHSSPKKTTPPKKYKAPLPPTPKVGAGPSPVESKPSTPTKVPLSPTRVAPSPTKGSGTPGAVRVIGSPAKSPAKGAQCVGMTPKKLNWDQKVLESLDKNNKTDLPAPTKTIAEESGEPPSTVKQLSSKIELKIPKSPVKTGAVAKQSALFEGLSSPSGPAKDPALLSVSERKALFEKVKGAALVPKAAFGMSAPVKVDATTRAGETKMIGASRGGETSRREGMAPGEGPAPKPPKVETVATVHQAQGIASKMAALLGSKSTISEEQIHNKAREQRQKDMDLLLNRFNRNKEVTKETIKEVTEESESDNENATEMTAMIKERAAKIVRSTSKDDVGKLLERKNGGKRVSTESLDSPKVISVVEDVKRIKISPPKAGRLYPNLSDIEGTTEGDTRSPSPDYNSSSGGNDGSCSDEAETSFGRDILQAVCENQTPQKRPINADSSSDDNNSDIMDELDEILEEFDDDSSAAGGPTPPKITRHASPSAKGAPKASDSFRYKSSRSPGTPKELPEFVVEGDDVLPLTHTVSFYRKQQNQAQTPVRQVSRQQTVEESPDDRNEEKREVEEKVRRLQDEVKRQENIISQTSQALNLCSCTPEFCGSTEQVEADKVLLVATHRRQAALHEIQRLKIEKTVRPRHSENLPLERGTLTISNVVLPMKQKYVTALAAAGGKGHHVVCLIKCGEQVTPTKLVSTVASKSKNPDLDLYVPGSIILKDVYGDFAVTFEVYCLQAQEECLPHEVKYHINKKGVSTPKKSKQDSRLVRKMTESPAGPQAVKSSSFALMGCVVFPVQTCSKKSWSLINTPSMSPLEGTVEMKVSCELAVSVEHRGFLTMFEDVSGFGAWHRRWCMLKGDTLCYWKYPDEEKKKAPIDTISLKGCINERVGPVSRDICARLHTFLIENERVAYGNDKDTLIMVRKGDKTIIRHLLSADTKEERIEWCNKFNAALTALRMWGNQH